MQKIKSYQELLAHFGATDALELHSAIERQLGRETNIYLHGTDVREFYIVPLQSVPADFRMISFTVSVRDECGNGHDNYFQLPLEEDNLAIGMVELEDPLKAEAEGEEFMFLLGQGRKEEVLHGR
jgi:hypothetical protein